MAAYNSQDNNFGPYHGMKIGGGQKIQQTPAFDPQQMELYQQLFGYLGPDSFLSRLASGDQSMFAEVEAPALKQFGELQGGMASKFSGMGMGGRHSSGFGNSMNAAASDFAQQLQSQRLGMRNQALQDLMGMSNTLLSQKPYDTMARERTHHGSGNQQGGWGGAASGAMAGAGTGAMLGPWGAAAGGIIGGLGGYFSKS